MKTSRRIILAICKFFKAVTVPIFNNHRLMIASMLLRFFIYLSYWRRLFETDLSFCITSTKPLNLHVAKARDYAKRRVTAMAGQQSAGTEIESKSEALQVDSTIGVQCVSCR